MIHNSSRRMMNSFRRPFGIWLLLLLGLLLLSAACGPTAPAGESEGTLEQPVDSAAAATATPMPIGENAYPAPQAPLPTEAPGSYPVEPDLPPTATPFPDVYPPPPAEEQFLEPRFAFDLPLQAGAAVVTGQAPPNLSIALVDVTSNGTLLGSGVTTADGTFSIGVQGLPEGNRIGITFGELEPGLDIADMSIKYFPYRGENFMNLPNVGIMLETALVGS